MTELKNHSVDKLDRNSFIAALEKNIETLAAIKPNQLATPRVIAVDAKWGNGKTWVATELASRLVDKSREAPYRVVTIDAFRYDHHDDAFAVIASAIYKELKPTAEKKAAFLSVAGAVLKSAAPIAAKTALTLGAKAIGLEGTLAGVVDAAKDSISSISEKAIEKLLESYSDTEKIQREFSSVLEKLAGELDSPLVVIVDELDRCRPSFSLEVLERIKHLFDAKNIVFLLFWNSDSIHESIRHTYGQKTDAENYLSKFIAFSIPLDLPQTRGTGIGARYDNFVRAMSDVYFPSQVDAFDFNDAFKISCGILEPSLRQVLRAMQLSAHTGAYKSNWTAAASYLILLKATDEERFRLVSRLDPSACSIESNRIQTTLSIKANDQFRILYAIFTFAAERKRFDEIVRLNRRRELQNEKLTDLEREILTTTDAGDLIPHFESEARTIIDALTNKKI